MTITKIESFRDHPTFGVEASALSQRISMFDILSSAPPDEKLKNILMILQG